MPVLATEFWYPNILEILEPTFQSFHWKNQKEMCLIPLAFVHIIAATCHVVAARMSRPCNEALKILPQVYAECFLTAWH